MEENLHIDLDFEIDAHQIWNELRFNFDEDKITPDQAEEFLNKVNIYVITNTRPFITVDDERKDYYNKKLNRYLDAFENIQKSFQLGYTELNEKMYSFEGVFVIPKEHEDYAFFFAWKLFEYQSQLTNLDKFIDYQLKQHYDNDEKKFNRFLSLLLKQYKSKEIWNNELIEALQSRIDLTTSLETKPIISEEPKKVVPAIQIESKIIDAMVVGLRDYFEPEDHESLLDLLNGKSISQELNFNGTSRQLVQVFKSLILNEVVNLNQKQLASFILDNFKFYNQKAKEHTHFKLKSTLSDLSGKSIIVPKENRIQIEGLLNFFEKNN